MVVDKEVLPGETLITADNHVHLTDKGGGKPSAYVVNKRQRRSGTFSCMRVRHVVNLYDCLV